MALSIFWSAVLLAAAVSIDSFATGFSYGVSKIRLPAASILLISLICTLVTVAGLLCSRMVSPILSPNTARLFSFFILCAVAVSRLFDSMIRSLLRRHPALSKEMAFSLRGIRFILHICADHTAADIDRSHTLSPKEAVFLAAALSLDGGAAGIGAGFCPPPLLLFCLFSFFFTILSLCACACFGKRAAKAFPFDCGIAAGILLLIMALTRLV